MSCERDGWRSYVRAERRILKRCRRSDAASGRRRHRLRLVVPVAAAGVIGWAVVLNPASPPGAGVDLRLPAATRGVAGGDTEVAADREAGGAPALADTLGPRPIVSLDAEESAALRGRDVAAGDAELGGSPLRRR